MPAKQKAAKESGIVVRPLGGLGGLDNIHVALIALVILLIALLIVVSSSPSGGMQPNSTLTCAYGSVNGTCVMPLHNLSDAKVRLGQILASYAYVNGSLSILPYFSSIQNAAVDYIPQSRQWLGVVAVQNPYGTNFSASFLFYDSNFSLAAPYLQTSSTSKIFSNYVVSQGVVRLSGKVACLTQNPIQTYWFIDPYAPGSISSLNQLTSLQSKFGSGINATLKIVFGSESLRIANSGAGVNNTQALGKYIFCASKQSNFTSFVSNLQSLYSNAYVPEAFLNQIANQSKLNLPLLNSCVANSTATINNQLLLAQYYNVTSTPSIVTDCIYQSIPQTAQNAICLANSTKCQ